MMVTHEALSTGFAGIGEGNQILRGRVFTIDNTRLLRKVQCAHHFLQRGLNAAVIPNILHKQAQGSFGSGAAQYGCNRFKVLAYKNTVSSKEDISVEITAFKYRHSHRILNNILFMVGGVYFYTFMDLYIHIKFNVWELGGAGGEVPPPPASGPNGRQLERIEQHERSEAQLGDARV